MSAKPAEVEPPQALTPGQVRWALTWFGLKAERFAADAAELMGVHPQVVGGACHQIRHSNGGLLFHRDGFSRPVALETQERGPSHSGGVAYVPHAGRQLDVN